MLAEVEEAGEQENDLTNLRPTSKAQTISFRNSLRTTTVRVYWVNFQGKLTLYRTLKPGQAYTQHSFITHKWIVKSTTGQTLWRGAVLPTPRSVNLKAAVRKVVVVRKVIVVRKPAAIPTKITFRNYMRKTTVKVYWLNF